MIQCIAKVADKFTLQDYSWILKEFKCKCKHKVFTKTKRFAQYIDTAFAISYFICVSILQISVCLSFSDRKTYVSSLHTFSFLSHTSRDLKINFCFKTIFLLNQHIVMFHDLMKVTPCAKDAQNVKIRIVLHPHNRHHKIYHICFIYGYITYYWLK
jgi:hypothetical protein